MTEDIRRLNLGYCHARLLYSLPLDRCDNGKANKCKNKGNARGCV